MSRRSCSSCSPCGWLSDSRRPRRLDACSPRRYAPAGCMAGLSLSAHSISVAIQTGRPARTRGTTRRALHRAATAPAARGSTGAAAMTLMLASWRRRALSLNQATYARAVACWPGALRLVDVRRAGSAHGPGLDCRLAHIDDIDTCVQPQPDVASVRRKGEPAEIAAAHVEQRARRTAPGRLRV
jgi:hypothetical protein